MGGMDDIVAEFLAESVENLDQLDQDLVTLEKNPSDREIFAQIFRTIHTIKGTCGFLAFGTLESVTHVGESLLSRLREGSLDLRPEITTDLLALIDAVRAILANIDATGQEGDEGYADLIERLKSHGEGTESTAGIPEPGTSTPPSRTKARVRKKSATTSGKGARAKKKASDKKPARKQAEPTPEPTTADEDADELELTSTPTSAETSIRVDVRVLDHLMNLVGELVLSRNQLVQNVAGSTDSRLTSSSQRLDAITGELQEAVMRTRMQPISSIWKKLPRFTRDLSLKFGKQVEIEMEGEETDLDKSVIEAIKGSLLHLVRNAVDHGIEDPDAREKKGKPRSGTLRLRAHHEGGTVVIEVHDDGGGLDRDRILARAVENGLVTETESVSLSRNEIESFIFHPGFSTASKVTNISGRGVGLDVVRTNVERMGGSVELQSEPGESTTFRVKIPLTLAIVSVLLVAADEHRIAIPQASVVELIRLDDAASGLGIEDLNGVPVFRLRGNLLPLVFLNHELGIRNEDSQEIVVKPLGRLLSAVPFAGATILGNGQIALILDVFRLGLAAGVVSEARAHTVAAQVSAAVKTRKSRTRLVCIHGTDDERLAIEFDAVDRLENIPRSSIERVGNQQVIQYGDEILQLVELQRTLPERRKEARSSPGRADGATVPVVVCTVDGQRIGLIVHMIADIVEEELKARRPGSRDGIRGCAVIQDRVTEILDLEAVVRLADPEFFDRETG